MNAVEAQIFTVRIKQVNDNNSSINYGGCGLFAMALVKKLRKIGFNPQIVLVDFNIKSYIDHYVSYNEFDELFNKPSHVMVKVGKYYIDSTGAYTEITLKQTKWGGRGKLIIPPEKYKKAIFTDCGWNPYFKRKYSAFKDIINNINDTCVLVKNVSIDVISKHKSTKDGLIFLQ